jgi:hypothetical protein
MSEPTSELDETDLRLALVRRRYGNRLSPEQLAALRGIVRAIVDHAAALRSVRLTNADEPLQRFTPFRADE